MKFELNKSIEILENIPDALMSMLSGLSDDWVMNNEGEDTWSPYDVLGHLIHGEKEDWLLRTKIILSDSENKNFEPFDRYAQMKGTKVGKIEDLLKEFKELRAKNIVELKNLQIQESDFAKTGIHPTLGEVELKHLLATWVIHDLGHVIQISRVMINQYASEVGPWDVYRSVYEKHRKD